MANSLLSGSIGIPDGAYALLNPSDLERAVGFFNQNQQTLQTIIDQVTNIAAGSAEMDWATVSDDATILVQTTRNVISAELVLTGKYRVTRASAFPEIGGEPGAAPLVTPLGEVTLAPDVSNIDHEWFTTAGPNNASSGVQWDSLLSVVWATDFDHDTGFAGNPDRIAIGDPLELLPDIYWFLPTGYTNLLRTIGSTLILDNEFRLAYVQARNNDGSVNTTLFVDMDSLDVVYNSQVTLGGAGGICVLVGHSSDHLIFKHGSDFKILSRDGDGLPDTDLGNYSGSPGGTGFKHFMVANNGEFWSNNSTSPKDWVRFAISGGFVATVHDGGTNGIDERIYDFNPNDNSIYFLTDPTSDLHLKKQLCTSPHTLTTLTSSPYDDVLDVDTAPTTLTGATSMRFTPDYQKLIVVRGGDSANHPYIFLVDPADGSIETAVELPAPFSLNYNVEQIVSIGGMVVTIGNKNIQVINHNLDDAGSPTTYNPVVFASRMETTTAAIVEFWDASTLTPVNTGFHILFARD